MRLWSSNHGIELILIARFFSFDLMLLGNFIPLLFDTIPDY